MIIREIADGKECFLPLLLVGDEQEDMIRRYLDCGRLFILEHDGLKAAAVVTDEGGGICEVKNLAVEAQFQGRGYGSTLMTRLIDGYGAKFHTMRLGTGENPETLAFYQRLGFQPIRRVKDFFVDHYDHPIVEHGVRLTDMIILERGLQGGERRKC